MSSEKVKKPHRFWKNLLIWFLGFLFGLTFIFGGIAAAVGLVKVNTYTKLAGVKTDEYFSDKVANKTLLGIIQGIGDITVGDVPILEKTLNDLIKDADLDGLLEIDTGKLSELSISNAFSKLPDAVKVTATLKNVEIKFNNGDALFGSLEDLDIFSKWEQVDMSAFDPLSVKSDNDAKIYFYNNGGKYLEAFKGAPKDNVVQYAEGVNGATQLYLANLSEITADKLLSVFVNRLEKVKLISLLETFDSSVTENQLFVDALGNITIETIGDVDIEGIKVSSVLGENPNENIKNLLVDAGGREYEELTISDLKDMDVNSIRLLSVLGNGLDEDVKKLIGDAAGVDYENVTLSDLKEMNTSGIKISSVLGNNIEDKIKDLLADAGKKDYENLTVSDLKEMDVEAIKLSSVLGNDVEDSIKDLIADATQKDYSDVTLFDLEDMDVGAIKVSSVLWEEVEDDIKNLLADAGGKEFEELTISDLEEMDVGAIKISSVTELKPEDTLYKILADIYGEENVNSVKVGDVATIDINEVKFGSVINSTGDGNKKIYKVLQDAFGKADIEETRNVKIGEIETLFDMGKIKLATVMESPSDSLKNMLKDAMNCEWEDITVMSLSTFDVKTVKLNSFITNTDNKVLKALLAKDDVTISNMGVLIDDLKVEEIFDVETFVKDASGAYYLDTDGKYKLGSKVGCDNYKISENTKVWLFLLYDYSDVDEETGVAGVYTYNDLKFKDLQNEVNKISEKVLNATIRQLTDAGFNFGTISEKLYKYSLKGALEKLSEFSSVIS